MATLRSNTLVKIIIPVVALGAVAIGIRACSDKRVQQEAAVTIWRMTKTVRCCRKI